MNFLNLLRHKKVYGPFVFSALLLGSYLSIYLSVYLCLSVCLSIYLSIYRSVYLSICSQKDRQCAVYYQSANGPMVTHALGHMMYGYTLLVPMNQRVLNKSSKEHNKTAGSLPVFLTTYIYIYYAHLTSVEFAPCES